VNEHLLGAVFDGPVPPRTLHTRQSGLTPRSHRARHFRVESLQMITGIDRRNNNTALSRAKTRNNTVSDDIMLVCFSSLAKFFGVIIQFSCVALWCGGKWNMDVPGRDFHYPDGTRWWPDS